MKRRGEEQRARAGRDDRLYRMTVYVVRHLPVHRARVDLRALVEAWTRKQTHFNNEVLYPWQVQFHQTRNMATPGRASEWRVREQ